MEVLGSTIDGMIFDDGMRFIFLQYYCKKNRIISIVEQYINQNSRMNASGSDIRKTN